MRIWTLAGAAIVTHVVTFVLMLYGKEPFSTYFYIFAWWTYIVVLSSFNHSRGRNSLLLDTPGEFLWIFFYSTPVWLFFEIFNFSLNNWHYVGVPVETYLRWPGYVISFGTVLPGIFETETLVKNLGLLNRLPGRPIQVNPGLLVRCLVAGIVMLALAWIQPQFFFPLVWAGGVFLLDPLVYWQGRQETSFLGMAEGGDYAQAPRLLLAGMICGLLWEFWNFWAASKWVYTIPYLGFLKIFEMPLLGFFGFPPFALECYLSYRALIIVRERFFHGQKFLPVLATIFAIIYCVAAFNGIDRWTVEVYKISMF